VGRPDRFALREIGDRARDPEDAAEDPRGDREAIEDRLLKGLATWIERAEAMDLFRRHPGVYASLAEPFPGDLAGSPYARPHCRGHLPRAVGADRALEIEEDSERLHGPAPVPRAMRRGADAAVFVSVTPPARAARHGREKRDLGKPLRTPGNAEHTLFERRKKGAEGIAAELREVFQDEDPSMTELNLARTLVEAEKSPRRGCGGRYADWREVQVRTKLARPGVDGVDLPGIVVRKGRQEAWEGTDEPGLSGACGADEEEVMTAGERYLKRAPGFFVAGKIVELGGPEVQTDVSGSHGARTVGRF
jgi:hypothetical protein